MRLRYLLPLLPLLMAPDVGTYEQHFDLKNTDAPSDAIDVQILYEVKPPIPPPTGTSISTPQGITFTFDTTYSTGTYLDGQPWVVENTPGVGVRIQSMTPDYSGGRNGWFENRRLKKEIPYGQNGCAATGSCSLNTVDSRMSTPTTNNGWAFVAPTTYYGPLPRTVHAGTSVMKVISLPSCVGGGKLCILTDSVLTVLAAPPPSNSMRPPWMGIQKPHLVVTGINIATALLNLPLLGTGSQHTMAEVASSFGDYAPFLPSGILGEFDGQWMPDSYHKVGEAPGNGISYGCDTGIWLNEVILRLSQTGTVAEKTKPFYAMLQISIDNYYAQQDGKDWGSTGCIHHGRKSGIMWGGKILNALAANSGRAAAMAAYDNGTEAIDLDTYTNSASGEALAGAAASTGSEVDADGRRCISVQSGKSTISACDGLRDGGTNKFGNCPGGLGETHTQYTLAYQRTNNCWSQTAYLGMSDLYWGACAVARVYGFVQEWTAARADNDPGWINYCDRWHTSPWTQDSCPADHCSAYLNDMFLAYGCNSAGCIAARGGVND